MAWGRGRAGDTGRRRGWGACAGGRSCGAQPRAAPWRGACACGPPATPRPAPAGCAAGRAPPAPRGCHLNHHPRPPGSPATALPDTQNPGEPRRPRTGPRAGCGWAARPRRATCARFQCVCAARVSASCPPIPRRRAWGSAGHAQTRRSPNRHQPSPGRRHIRGPGPAAWRVRPHARLPQLARKHATSSAPVRQCLNIRHIDLPHSIWPISPMRRPHRPATSGTAPSVQRPPAWRHGRAGRRQAHIEPLLCRARLQPTCGRGANARLHAERPPHLDLTHGLGRREQPPRADEVLTHGVHGALDGRPARRGARALAAPLRPAPCQARGQGRPAPAVTAGAPPHSAASGTRGSSSSACSMHCYKAAPRSSGDQRRSGDPGRLRSLAQPAPPHVGRKHSKHPALGTQATQSMAACFRAGQA